MIQKPVAFNAALQIAQQVVTLLAKWADPQLASKCPHVTEDHVVTKAKQILSWSDLDEPKALRSLFDKVKLTKGQDKQYYWEPKSIDDSKPNIPYPQLEATNDFQQLKTEIKTAIEDLNDKDWNNLSLLMLIIEKFGSFLSFGESDVALIDITKTTAAVAAAIAKNPNPKELSLIAGDLSGIQKFIYTISSDGALKSLRARSFYLELVIQEVVQQLLECIQLPTTNIIYAGGGKFYLIASGDLVFVKECIEKVRNKFNKWLLNSFQGKLFLAIDCIPVPTNDLKDKRFADYWGKINKDLANQKACKFSKEIKSVIKVSRSHEPCRVCHRDDLPSLKPLIRLNEDSSPSCWVCRTMFELGENLFDVKVLLRSKRSTIKGHIDRICILGYYYYLFTNWQKAIKLAQNHEAVFFVNNWELKHYKSEQSLLLLLGNYGKESEIEAGRFIRAEGMAQAAKKAGAIPRVGYLRMDVDRLGKIFAEGLEEKKRNLPRIAGLSRQMSYFFKVYLNSLAEDRQGNIPDDIKQLKPKDNRLNLLFIYAGGDDLFISGAWNEIVEFAFDIYQSFRAYTGYNPDITLSGGISIDEIKFPIYQSAKFAENAEDAAKDNGRDSLGLFGQVFKWDEWLGNPKTTEFDEVNEKYRYQEKRPKLLGIFPFVNRLEQQNIGVDYARSFVRNLLITAQIQEEALKKFKDNQEDKEAKDTRYYLHLPKIAYTLARLPKEILNDSDFRTSLKSPYNAPYFRAIATWIELLNRG